MQTRLVTRAALALLVAAACSTSEQVAELGLGDACVIGSDCKAPLLCVFARCHEQCTETRDCPAGQRCVLGSQPEHVCQLAVESDCEYNSDCSAPQVCAVDGQCRDQCATSADCVSGQLCVSGTCADESELVNGRLPGETTSGGLSCVWDSDCAAGMHCKKQQCVYDCLEDIDCGAGQSCLDHRCVRAERRLECVAGEQPHCSCADGSSGVRVCGPDNTWGPCMCPSSGAGGAPASSSSSAGGGGGLAASSSSAASGGMGGMASTSTGMGGGAASASANSSSGAGGGSGTTTTASSSSTVGAGGGASTTTSTSSNGAGGAGGVPVSASSGGGIDGGGGAPATTASTSGSVASGGGADPSTTGGGGIINPPDASPGDAAVTDISIDSDITKTASAWFGAPAGELLVSFALPGVAGARAAVDDFGEATVVGGAASRLELAGEPLATDGDDIVVAWLDGIDVHRAVSYPTAGAQEITALASDRSGGFAVIGAQASSAELDFGTPRSRQRDRWHEPLEGTGGFVAMLGPDGRGIWQARLSGSGTVAASALDMDAHGVVVVGEMSDTLRIGRHVVRSAAGRAAFVARFDADGQLAWLRSFGERGAVTPHAVVVDAYGGVVVAGALRGRLDVDGLSLESAGGDDVLLLRLDAGGAMVDGARFGDEEHQEGRALALRADGGLLVAGRMHGTLDLGGGAMRTRGSSDAFAAAFDERGTHRWSQSIGGRGADVAVAVVEDGAGEVVLAGDFADAMTVAGEVIGCGGLSDAFVAKLDATGEPVWVRGFGNAEAQHATSAAIAPSDAIVVGVASAGGLIDLGAGAQRGESYAVVLSP